MFALNGGEALNDWYQGQNPAPALAMFVTSAVIVAFWWFVSTLVAKPG